MKVTVITPTLTNRNELLRRCIRNFINQDYPNKEMIINQERNSNHFDIYDILWLDRRLITKKEKSLIGTADSYWDATIGAKRNDSCKAATGEIILHMDDDDLYAPDWISKSVEHLINSKADITGLSAAYFYDAQNTKLNSWNWYDSVPRPTQPYVNEATMCYWRRVWENNPFPDTSEGEGRQFLANAGRCIPHDYKDGFAAIVHGGNICSHKSLKLMKALPLSNASELLRNHYPMPRQ